MSCPSGEQLRGYLDERLEDFQREIIEKHAEDCAACQQRLANLASSAFVTPVRARPVHEPNEAFLQRLKQGVLSSSTDLRAGSRSSLRTASRTLAPRVPGFEILHELGRGGMGVVYKARQLSLGRLVALKMILAGAHASPQEHKRFHTEAEAVARLQHPNIVQIHEVGESDGHPFFSLEFVEGLSLAQRLTGSPLPVVKAASLVETLARAVHYAHERGVLHRDLKPANILLAVRTGRSDSAADSQKSALGDKSALLTHDISLLTPKIADFGLAKHLGDEAGATRTGSVLGTPDYISPEQAAGTKGVGPAADIYALGAILYECLTSRPPFRNDTPLDTLLQVTSVEPVPPSRLQPKLPRDLETICLKCLEKDPRARYATAADLADDLRRFVDGQPIAARPVGFSGRLWRWARRKPVTAALTGAVAALLTIVAVGSTGTALYLKATLTDSESNRGRAEHAERDAQDKLWRSYREQARALRLSGETGQRFESLKALAEATRIARSLQVDENEILSLRNEAIACLAQPDWRYERTLMNNVSNTVPHNYWIAFDRQFEHFVYSDREGNLSIRRVSDGAESARIDSPATCEWDWVTLQFSPDGRWLHATHTGPENNPRFHAAVWEFSDGKIGKSVVLDHRCAFSPDSRLLAGARRDGAIGVYEVATGREINRLGEGLMADRVWFAPNGRELAVTSRVDKHNVVILDLETGDEVGQRYEHDADVNDIAWRGDNRLLAMACDDQRIYVWDHAQQRLQSVLEGHAGLGIVVTFSPGNDFLISASWDGTTLLWDPVAGRQLVRGHCHCADIRSDGRQLAILDPENRLVLWELAGGWEYRTLHHGMVGNRTPRPSHWGPTSSDFSLDGRLFATCHIDGVRLWDLVTFNELGHIPVSATASVRFHPDGKSIFSYGVSGAFRWPLERDDGRGDGSQKDFDVVRVGLPQVFDVPGNWYYPELFCDSTGKRIIVIDYPGSRAILFDLDDPSKKVVLSHTKVAGCFFSPDGRWLCTLSPMVLKDYAAKIWDTSDGKLVWQIPAGEIVGYFTPDGRWLVTVPSGDEPLHQWEVGSWQPGPTMPRHSAKQVAMWFSPDGTLLIPVEQGPPRFIQAETGKELARFEAPRDFGGMSGAQFSPDGAWIATSTGNHTSHLWDLSAVRRGLNELRLDWDSPSHRPLQVQSNTTPIHLEIPDDVQAFATADRRVARGYWLAQRGRFDEAQEAFDEAIRLRPGDAKGYGALSWLLSSYLDPKFRNPGRAVEYAKQAIDLDSEGSLPWHMLGGALYRIGAWQECVDAIERSIRLQNDGGGPGQWLLLAMAQSRMGNKETAGKWYDQCVRWIESSESPSEEIRRLRNEAATVLASTDPSER